MTLHENRVDLLAARIASARWAPQRYPTTIVDPATQLLCRIDTDGLTRDEVQILASVCWLVQT